MSRARKGMSKDPEPDRHFETELRQGAGREWLEEAAEDEHLSEILRRRRLDLQGRLRETASRGDRIRAETSGQTFAGVVASVGSDFATIARTEDIVDVVSTHAVWTIETSHTGGTGQAGDVLTFRARLMEIAEGGAQVRLVTSGGPALVGSIDLVATDHIEVSQDSNRLVIPLDLIDAVISSNREF
ncbi:MAG: hypothetical protein WBZ40_09995 [Acidimicrobiia bacterium]